MNRKIPLLIGIIIFGLLIFLIATYWRGKDVPIVSPTSTPVIKKTMVPTPTSTPAQQVSPAPAVIKLEGTGKIFVEEDGNKSTQTLTESTQPTPSATPSSTPTPLPTSTPCTIKIVNLCI